MKAGGGVNTIWQHLMWIGGKGTAYTPRRVNERDENGDEKWEVINVCRSLLSHQHARDPLRRGGEERQIESALSEREKWSGN